MKKTILFTIFITLFTIFNLNSKNIKLNDSGNKIYFNEISKSSFELKINISEIQSNELNKNSQNFDNISINNWGKTNEIGLPALPSKKFRFAVPDNMTITIKDIKTRRIESEKPFPKQKAHLDGIEFEQPQFQFDKNSYSKTSGVYPENFFKKSHTFSIRNVQMQYLEVNPIKYDFRQEELIIAEELVLEITINGNHDIFTDKLKYYKNFFKAQVKNNKWVDLVQTSEKSSKDYLILTTQDFQNAAETFKLWKEQMGYNTEIAYLENIGSSTSDIKNYFENAYNEYSSTYALIIGDSDIVPCNYESGEYADPATDLPYFCFDGAGDYYPEMVYGRISVEDNEQALVALNKIINYEKNPYEDASFYSKATTAAYFQDDDMNGYADRRFTQTAEEIRDLLLEKDYDVERIYCTNPSVNPTNYNNGYYSNGEPIPDELLRENGFMWDGDEYDITNAFNNGTSFILHRDHGISRNYTYAGGSEPDFGGWGDPYYTTDHVEALTNEELPFVFSINCQTGWFDGETDPDNSKSYESFCEELIRNPNGGAVAALGASRSSLSGYNDYLVRGLFDSMWEDFIPDFDPLETYGEIGLGLQQGLLCMEQDWGTDSYSKYEYQLFHIFGDPSMKIWTDVPAEITTEVDPIIPMGSQHISVSTNIENGTASITNADGLVGRIDFNSNNFNIPIDAELAQPQELTVTIVSHNHRPFITTTQLQPADGPYVIAQLNSIDDENENGIAENNENILLNIDFSNVGVEDVENLDITLSSESNLVTVNQDTAEVSAIAAEEVITLDSVFDITLASYIENGTVLDFNIEITDGTEVWNSPINIEVSAPEIEISGYEIDDSSGNNNGRLDPNETVNFLLNLENTGSAITQNITSYISCDDQYVTFENIEFVNNPINPAETAEVVFTVLIGNAPTGHSVTFAIDSETEFGYNTNYQMIEYVGQIPVLILDFDENNSSAPIMAETLDNIGIGYESMSAIPEDINLYASIFLCLGIYSNNSQLSSTQGDELAAYLDNGGKLYMEGGDTWAFDDQTAAHAMFNINGDDDGSGDLGTIIGQDGTFTDGMNFSYSGENNWIDQISAIGDAEVILSNQSPSYGCAVAYTDGSYSTIGASFEFGGLDDGSNTKVELMNKYLEFFGIISDGPSINPIQNLTGASNGNPMNDVLLTWDAPALSDAVLTGYEIFQDGTSLDIVSTDVTTYTVENLANDTYEFGVKAIYEEGSSAMITVEVSINVDGNDVTFVTELAGNYPNPFNPETEIKFSLNSNSKVLLTIYNIKGQKVKTLVEDEMEAGKHQVIWKGKNDNNESVASGVYFYRFETMDYSKTEKMILLK